MTAPYAQYQKEGKILSIYYDEDAESPRNWDPLSTMICWHGRYSLGDKHQFESPSEFRKSVNKKDIIVLPIYLYDHSGLAFSTTPFSCPWDSGQVGYIYAEKRKAREWFGVKRLSKKIVERVKQVMKSELEVYEDYVEGRIFGFIIEDKKGNHLDSCWGFYGSDFTENGMAEHLDEDWKKLIA